MSDTLRINNLFTTAIGYSTLTGSTITTNSLSLSTLTVSSINSGAPGVAAYSTLNVSTLNATSTITASTITTTSNVGVGTNAPANLLDVSGSSTVLARFQSTADYGRIVLDGPSGGDIIYKTGGVSKWGIACISNHLQFLLNDSPSTVPVTFTSGGNVGIGITNPTYPFSVAGTIQAINTTNDTMGLFSTTYGGYLHIGSWTASGGGSKNIVMQQMGGYVGIGTNAPTQPLHVYQATSSAWSGRLVAGGSTNVFIAGEYNGAVNCGGHNFALNQWTAVTSGSTWTFTSSISKAGGTFDIGHPLYPNTSKRLVHSFVEGPRCDLIYRGKTTLVNGSAVVDINKECTHSPECAMDDGTFEALCANPQIFLQNNQSFDRVRGAIAGCILTITSENSVSNVVIEWMVIAERVDSFIKQWDRTNPDGYLITQYTKGPNVVAPPYV